MNNKVRVAGLFLVLSAVVGVSAALLESKNQQSANEKLPNTEILQKDPAKMNPQQDDSRQSILVMDHHLQENQHYENLMLDIVTLEAKQHQETGVIAPIDSANIMNAAAAPVSAEISQNFRIPVLNYHSVKVEPGNIVVISPEKLDEQMAYLAAEGYTTLRMQEFIDIWDGKKSAPPKPVLLTFDDGYTDNYEHAMPILKKYGFHATLFMSPGWVDMEGYLNWEQVKEMKEAGWDIYPHGMTHPSLSKLSKEEQAFEIAESRKLIEEHFGGTADVFCYPYGHYNNTTVQLLKDHGFRFAFTINQGRTDTTQDPLLLKRLFINGEESLKAFINKLSWK